MLTITPATVDGRISSQVQKLLQVQTPAPLALVSAGALLSDEVIATMDRCSREVAALSKSFPTLVSQYTVMLAVMADQERYAGFTHPSNYFSPRPKVFYIYLF